MAYAIRTTDDTVFIENKTRRMPADKAWGLGSLEGERK